MGGAIALGLSGKRAALGITDITVIDIEESVLDRLKSADSGIKTTLSDDEAIAAADIVMIALKPWLVEGFLIGAKNALDYDRQIIVSVAAGVTFEHLKSYLRKISSSVPVIFRVMPNTAISVGESMTFLSSYNASEEQEKLLSDIFGSLGKALLVDEKHLPAGTALASCGIAYVFRYIRAAMEAGVEIGFYPDQAKEVILQTMQGAVEILKATGNHPEQEIDKVTTPAGITIKGLNTMEEHGFTNAVIQGIKASNIKNE